uniref:Uncharacterized protein n=1 Tax=Arundo donax TaxID=35708 RepID=A0A0A9HD95_ARUDO
MSVPFAFSPCSYHCTDSNSTFLDYK